MEHYGDITKLSGYELPIVDVIIGGSPCQDLSIAGKRAGIDGERSGLFAEQVRIVKEMRERDKLCGRTGCFIRPRYMVWENVPGAFSSHKGEDFKQVLTEIIKIAESEAPDLSMPDKGRWTKAGCIYDEMGRWSIAWRVHDAQFWGVPQRRKRIALVADFGGLSAPEILFERKGVSWYPAESRAEREGTAGATEDSVGETGELVIEPRTQDGCARIYRGVTPTLNTASGGQRQPCVICLQGNDIDRADTAGCNGKGWNDEGVSYTLNTIDRPAVVAFEQNQRDEVRTLGDCSSCVKSEPGMKNQTYVVLNDQGGRQIDVTIDKTATLRAQEHGHQPIVFEPGAASRTGGHVYADGVAGTAILQNQEPICITPDGKNTAVCLDAHYAKAPGARGGQERTVVCCCVGNGQLNQISMAGQANTFDTMHDQQAVLVRVQDVAHTLKAKANCQYREDSETYPIQNNIVRRLTPLEAERLQGMPDGWTDIGPWMDSKGKIHKESSDSARYKAIGNGIATPFWFWLLRRISAQYERPATLGSLFDGISSFPYLWEKCNGEGTAIWCSEIDEFAIAVSKYHFPEVNDNDD